MPLLTRFLRAWILPPGGPLVVGVVALTQWERRPRAAKWGLWLSLLSLYLISLDWFAPAAFWVYNNEPRLTPEQIGSSNCQAIVVLGGGHQLFEPEYSGPNVSDTSLIRVRYGCLLQRKLSLPIVFTGRGEGQTMSAVARELAVPANMIIAENQSGTTYENAQFTRAILADRQIQKVLVVTEAFHLRRACRVFRNVGFEAVAAGCDYPGEYDYPNVLMRFVPRASSVQRSSRVLEEMGGTLFYELF